jgi:hypothetical protein
VKERLGDPADAASQRTGAPAAALQGGPAELHAAVERTQVALSSLVIYLGWVPFPPMDLFVTVYQAVCFPDLPHPQDAPFGLPGFRS